MAEAGRVVTGSAKGIRLLAPGPGTRPLPDRLKQALFASLEAALGTDWPVPFLDLYAGSGAGGIEATWTAIARRMGGSVTRPRTLGKGCCCGRYGCNFGQMDVSGMCGRGARNVCARLSSL